MKFQYYLDVYPHNASNPQFPPIPTTYPVMPKPEGCVRFSVEVDVGEPFADAVAVVQTKLPERA